MSLGELCGELDVELNNKVASLEVPLDGPEGVVVEDGHADVRDDLLGGLVDDLIDCDLDGLVVDAGEVNGHGTEAVEEADLVGVDDVVALSLELRVAILDELND